MRIIAAFATILLYLGLASNVSARTATATLINNTSFDIHAIFLSPSSDSHWGPDQLGDDILESEYSFTLRGMPCDEYDIKLIDEDGDACVIKGDYLCGDAGDWILTNEELLDCQGFKTTTASASLINNSSFDIYELYISPSAARRWGPDQLGNEILEPGYSYTFSGLDCGKYDFKLVDEDGDVCILNEAYLCGAEGEAVLTDKDLLDCQGY